METVVLTNPIDMHIHLRQDELLRTVLPYSATYFSACLAMPNLIPPLMTTESVLQYKQQIMQESHTAILDTHLKQTRHFIPLMSLYIHDNLNVAEIHKALLRCVFPLLVMPVIRRFLPSSIQWQVASRSIAAVSSFLAGS